MRRFPGVPLMALTATATPRVQHDVVQQLGIQQCLMFKSSFNRPNLRQARLAGMGATQQQHNSHVGLRRVIGFRLLSQTWLVGRAL